MVGSLGGGFWGQVHDYIPDDEDKAVRRGRLLAAVSVELGEERELVELVETGREILGRLHELYYGGEDEGPMQALRKAMEKTVEEFEQVDIAGLAIVGNYVYVGTGGRGGVWATTGDRQGFISKPAGKAGGISVLSGPKKPGMCFLAGNGDLWDNLASEDREAVMRVAGPDMEEAVELLTTKTGNGGKGKVAIILRIPEAVPEAEEQIVEEVRETPEKPQKANRLMEAWRNYRERIYVNRGDKETQRKKARIVGIGFLVLLLIMVGAGQLRGKNVTEQKTAKSGEIEQLTADFREAMAMAEVNPGRSKELLEKIKIEIEKYKTEKNPDAQITDILSQFDGVWMTANGVTKSETTELVNLSLVREGISAGAMAWSGDKLYVLDTAGGRVVEIDVTKSSGKIVGGGVDGAKLIAGYPGRVMVLGGNGISQVGAAEVKVKTDTKWKNITGMGMFAGNIYLLDAGAGEIWRLAVKGDGYAAGQEWLSDDNDREGIKAGTGMTIDGSIWVVGAGRIDKYTRGVKDSYEVSGLEQMWGEGAKVFTSDETEKVYVLDPMNSRVVVLGKDGKYQKQYLGEGWNGMMDVAVEEKSGTMFLSGNDKVWSVKL